MCLAATKYNCAKKTIKISSLELDQLSRFRLLKRHKLEQVIQENKSVMHSNSKACTIAKIYENRLDDHLNILREEKASKTDELKEKKGDFQKTDTEFVINLEGSHFVNEEEATYSEKTDKYIAETRHLMKILAIIEQTSTHTSEDSKVVLKELVDDIESGKKIFHSEDVYKYQFDLYDEELENLDREISELDNNDLDSSIDAKEVTNTEKVM